jgi:ribosome-associated heat shock protein Hsp15|tara:strand:- start:312 stop:689 length:378 start_codon:yes stop_codon:yes gene_type:complete
MEKTATQRLDKWLWYARICKSRTQATNLCKSGAIRVNRNLVSKPNQRLRVDDVLTFVLGQRIRIFRLVALGERRGPFIEAQSLYEDLSPATPSRVSEPMNNGWRTAGSGRPTKRDRRAIDELKKI